MSLVAPNARSRRPPLLRGPSPSQSLQTSNLLSAFSSGLEGSRQGLSSLTPISHSSRKPPSYPHLPDERSPFQKSNSYLPPSLPTKHARSTTLPLPNLQVPLRPTTLGASPVSPDLGAVENRPKWPVNGPKLEQSLNLGKCVGNGVADREKKRDPIELKIPERRRESIALMKWNKKPCANSDLFMYAKLLKTQFQIAGGTEDGSFSLGQLVGKRKRSKTSNRVDGVDGRKEKKRRRTAEFDKKGADTERSTKKKRKAELKESRESSVKERSRSDLRKRLGKADNHYERKARNEEDVIQSKDPDRNRTKKRSDLRSVSGEKGRTSDKRHQVRDNSSAIHRGVTEGKEKRQKDYNHEGAEDRRKATRERSSASGSHAAADMESRTRKRQRGEHEGHEEGEIGTHVKQKRRRTSKKEEEGRFMSSRSSSKSSRSSVEGGSGSDSRQSTPSDGERSRDRGRVSFRSTPARPNVGSSNPKKPFKMRSVAKRDPSSRDQSKAERINVKTKGSNGTEKKLFSSVRPPAHVRKDASTPSDEHVGTPAFSPPGGNGKAVEQKAPVPVLKSGPRPIPSASIDDANEVVTARSKFLQGKQEVERLLERKEFERAAKLFPSVFKQGFSWALAKETQYRHRYENSRQDEGTKVVKRTECCDVYHYVASAFAKRVAKELSMNGKQKLPASYSRNLAKAYSRMFILQRLHDRDKRHRGKVLLDKLQTHNNPTLTTGDWTAMRQIAHDYVSGLSYYDMSTAIGDDGGEEAGAECRIM